MGMAKLNIWLRYADCSLITDCWRTDLVIKSCCGESVVSQDPTIIDQLKERYPDYKYVQAHDYQGEKRIMLSPDGKPGGRSVYHIEVDVPPGCYVVWTRICYNKNEETNKVMVIVGCGDDACVNLLLDAVETCTNNALHPILDKLQNLGYAKEKIRLVAEGLMAVAEKPKNDLVLELDQRRDEVRAIKDPGLEKRIGAIKETVKPIKEYR